MVFNGTHTCLAQVKYKDYGQKGFNHVTKSLKHDD